MKKKLLFLSALGLSLAATAQETIYSEDFESGTFSQSKLQFFGVGQMSVSPGAPFGMGAKYLKISMYNSSGSDRSDLLYQHGSTMAGYDSLEATFDFNTTAFSASRLSGGTIQMNGESSFPLSYHDPVPNKTFQATVVTNTFREFRPGRFGGKVVKYDAAQRRVTLRWVNLNTASLTLLTHTYTESYSILGSTCPGMMPYRQMVVDCFCNTTTNPSDCKAKTTFHPFFPSVTLDMDNITIKGYKKTITGLDESEQVSNRKLLRAVDVMGRDIPYLEAYQGTAILLYSDGTREKVLR